MAIQKVCGVRADQANEVFPSPGIFPNVGKDAEKDLSHFIPIKETVLEPLETTTIVLL